MFESSRSEKDKEDGYKPQKTPPLTVEIEQRVLEDCKALCIEQLKRYPTTWKVPFDSITCFVKLIIMCRMT